MPKNFGPGPGAYALPPCVGYEKHDFIHYRYPQYSMGIKLAGDNKSFKTPGPQYSLGGYTRYGKHTPNAFTMPIRYPEQTKFTTPAPCDYAPEKAPRMRETRPPAYSIYSRHPLPKRFQTPGPNQYGLPPVLGPKCANKPASAAYTMAPRFASKQTALSPGPADYGETKTDLYKHRSPTFSMGMRCPPPGGKMQNPGPAAYYPKLPQTIPGGISMGIKTTTAPYITAADDMPCIDD